MNGMDIRNMDCLEGLRTLEDGSIDLVVTDPPYEFRSGQRGGCFGVESRGYHKELAPLSDGMGEGVLEELMRVMRKPNMYIWCSKGQVRRYLDFFEDEGCTYDILTWHKTNPVPTCSNKYLSDTEYCLYFRKGADLYGTYESKRKWWVSPTNVSDKDAYGHPTVKPLSIIMQLVSNSSLEGDVVLDPYIGSGTTAVACQRLSRRCVGFEIDPAYHRTALRRLSDGGSPTLDAYGEGRQMGDDISRLRQIWRGIKDRCENKADHDYPKYGGHGIKVCDGWHDFDAFREWALSHGYRDGMTLDRICNNRGYEPGNCRWVTRKGQAYNRQTNVVYTCCGRTQTLTQWADEMGVDKRMIWKRIKKGWPVEEAILTPPNGRRR